MPPFRELFHELSPAEFAEAQMLSASEPVERLLWRSSDWPFPGATACTLFGWRDVEVWRNEQRKMYVVDAVLQCGHRARYEITNMVFAAAQRPLVALVGAVDGQPAPCACDRPR